jgi:hypothetical protein
MFLAVGVPVEPAMRQPEVPLQVRNRRALTAATAKAAGGRSNDARACLLFMLGRVSRSSRDDVYHLYRGCQTGSFKKKELMSKMIFVNLPVHDLAASTARARCRLDDEPDGEAHGCLHVAGSASRFKELDRIPVRILDLDLSTTATGFHLVAKVNAGLL